MMLVTLRDMQWRARRIVIGLAATSLVLAIAALLGALHDGFLDETDRTIAFFGGDTWVIPAGVSGPFTSNSPMPQAWADRLRGEAGPQTVTPVAIFRHAIQGRGDGLTDVNVIAYAPNGVVVPHIEQGRSPTAPGEAAVDVQLGAALGDVITLAGRQLVVVGEVRGLTYNGGTPTVLITLDDGQRIAYDGRALASALIVRGTPEGLPAELATMSPSAVRDDLRRPLAVATTAIGLVTGMLWLVTAAIVGMLAFLSGLDRHRDFAVFKAHGVTTGRLVVSLLLEAALVSLLAGGVALLVAHLLLPLFPLEITLGVVDSLRLVGLSLLVGVAASTLSVRGVVRVDPAIAFAST